MSSSSSSSLSSSSSNGDYSQEISIGVGGEYVLPDLRKSQGVIDGTRGPSSTMCQSKNCGEIVRYVILQL